MAATEHEYTPPTQATPTQTSSRNISNLERWLSVLGGGSLLGYGAMRRSWLSAGLALLGGALVQRGLSAQCKVYELLGIDTSQRDDLSKQGIEVERTVTVNRAPQDVYGYWRNFENLPWFMEHLQSVQIKDDGRSHWVARAPFGTTVEWDAEIVEERPNEIISWRSLPGAQVENAGTVRFKPAPNNQGTEVSVHFVYNPPAGVVGATVAKLFGEEPQQQINDDLRHLKHILEAGEIPTNQGQPSGRRAADMESYGTQRLSVEAYKHKLRAEARDNRAATLEDCVEVASDESFPASDPPGWTSRRSFT